jgi:hypothetical protein
MHRADHLGGAVGVGVRQDRRRRAGVDVLGNVRGLAQRHRRQHIGGVGGREVLQPRRRLAQRIVVRRRSRRRGRSQRRRWIHIIWVQCIRHFVMKGARISIFSTRSR